MKKILICTALVCFALPIVGADADEYRQCMQILCAPELGTLKIDSVVFHADLVRDKKVGAPICKEKYNLYNLKKDYICSLEDTKYLITKGEDRSSILVKADEAVIADVSGFWGTGPSGTPPYRMEITITNKLSAVPEMLEIAVIDPLKDKNQIMRHFFTIEQLKQEPLTAKKLSQVETTQQQLPEHYYKCIPEQEKATGYVACINSCKSPGFDPEDLRHKGILKDFASCQQEKKCAYYRILARSICEKEAFGQVKETTLQSLKKSTVRHNITEKEKSQWLSQ